MMRDRVKDPDLQKSGSQPRGPAEKETDLQVGNLLWKNVVHEL